ncbi:MAG TPA: cytochrome b [Rhodopila sp.]|nr:cytochrome b [Rhodopila sp.]
MMAMLHPVSTTPAKADIASGHLRTRYDNAAIALHWATVVLVVLQFALSQLWGFFDRPDRHLMIVAHMSFGIILSVVIAARIAWRLTPGHRVAPATTGLEELAARIVHFVLYVLLACEAILGFTLRWSGNEAMSFFGLWIAPPFAPFSKPAHHLVETMHAYTGWTIVILATCHAVMALIHHYVLRDTVLRRMLPAGKATP